MLTPLRRWTPRLTWAEKAGFSALVISAPVDGSGTAEGDIPFTATASAADGSDVQYEWETDTASPPDSGNDDYQDILSGYRTSGAAATVYGIGLTSDTWYLRVRVTDGTHTTPWTSIRTLYVYDEYKLLPGSTVTRTTLGIANGVIVKVEGTATTSTATNSDAAYPPTYASSPRELLVIIKAGNQAAADAAAALALAYRKVERVALSGLQVRLDQGINLDVGDKVAVNHAASGVDGIYVVRKIVHDFAAAVTSLDIGELSRPTDDASLFVALAAQVEQVKKEVA